MRHTKPYTVTPSFEKLRAPFALVFLCQVYFNNLTKSGFVFLYGKVRARTRFFLFVFRGDLKWRCGFFAGNVVKQLSVMLLCGSLERRRVEVTRGQIDLLQSNSKKEWLLKRSSVECISHARKKG